ncbi:SH3 domain-containing protein [Pleomorphomonas sp. JP5]|uniref:SH3 domain-containing protein n=1 Tax=Pleomorphomonas sp. JP5 TaxID=2942998 RepID=UPI0038620C78
MSTTANVRLRSTEAADAPIIRTLKKGTAVEVSASSGDRLKVSVPSLGLTGWVHRDYVAEGTTAALVAPAQSAAPKAAPALKAAKPSPPKLRTQPAPGNPIRDPVYGSCDCPYDYARNGSRCGGRSAYSRPGGREPVCYYE